MPTETPVEYRDILGFPGYRVGNDGSVWCCRGRGGLRGAIGADWRRLSVKITADGYHRVTLVMPGIRREVVVSVLVLEAFVGPRPNGMQACHFPDRDRANNRVGNLRWDTPKNNIADMALHGTVLVGERNHKAKLTADQVREMRSMRESGLSHRQLSEIFGVSKHQVQLIVNGRNWSHL